MQLSKSQYIRGLQCVKSLWLFKNKPDLRSRPDETQQTIFDTGTHVGVLAQQLFPGGSEIVFDYTKINENIQKTQKLIDTGIKTIYEATFLYDDVLVMVDILHQGKNGWELYEVKSSTALKQVNENDIALQYYVVEGAGIPLHKASLIHINNQYTRSSQQNIKELFIKVDITDSVRAGQERVVAELIQMKNKVAMGRPMPIVDIGPHCFDPYKCDYYQHCWQHIPKNSIFDLTGMVLKKKCELYHGGISSFADIPNDYPLTHGQKIQIEAHLHGTAFFDTKAIEEFLESIQGSIGFLDFETFQQAIPKFSNQHPYQHIPFQYSLHYIKDKELHHTEFLGEPGHDPRRKLVSRLIHDTKGLETILVYNMVFEKNILIGLAKCFPEDHDAIHSIISKLRDLMVPFRNKAFYVQAMAGSYSIKKVLPALVPELSYDGMDIGDGRSAMRSYTALFDTDDPQIIEKTKRSLLEYCRLDTFSMVKILDKLKEVTPGMSNDSGELILKNGFDYGDKHMLQSKFINEMMEQILEGSKIPKVQVERAISPILGMFMPEILTKLYSKSTASQYEMIMPEFPLKKDESNQSTNIDYLLINREQMKLVLFELKTDRSSFKKDQMKIYEELKEKIEIQSALFLLEDLGRIQNASEKNSKYQYVLEKCKPYRDLFSDIKTAEIIYLSPEGTLSGLENHDIKILSFHDLPQEIQGSYSEEWRIIHDYLLRLDENMDALQRPFGIEQTIVNNIETYINQKDAGLKPLLVLFGKSGKKGRPNYQIEFSDGSIKTFYFSGKRHSTPQFSHSNLSPGISWDEIRTKAYLN